MDIKSVLTKTRTETTKWFDITGAEPIAQWDSTVAPGPMLTPCTVRAVWSDDGDRRTVSMWGYRVKKDGTRSAHEPSEIMISRHSADRWPVWLIDLITSNTPPVS